MKLTIIIIQFMELSKVVLKNLQYLPLLQLHSPFQYVVLDGRIVNSKQFKLFTVANKKCDIANSFM